METPIHAAPPVALDRLVRLSPSMLSIGNRDADRWGIQLTWPEVRFKRCKYSGRRDYYATGATTIRLAWGPEEICAGLSLLGFGIGAIYLPNALGLAPLPGADSDETKHESK